MTPPSRLSTVFRSTARSTDQTRQTRQARPDRPGCAHQICGFQGCTFSCLAWAEMRRHKKEEHSGKKGFFCFKCEKPFSKFPRLVANKRKVCNSLLPKCWRRKIILTFSRTMKVAHFEDKPERHEPEERKAYIAAVLMANPEYLDSLAPKPFIAEHCCLCVNVEYYK